MVESVTSNALQGLQRAQNGMRRSASDIARSNNSLPNENTKDLTRSLVELKQYKNAGVASIKVLETAEEMLGSILDIKV